MVEKQEPYHFHILLAEAFHGGSGCTNAYANFYPLILDSLCFYLGHLFQVDSLNGQ